MSTHAHDDGAPHSDATDERYATLRLADGAVVIYDESNHRAWLQSDLAESLDGMV